MAAERIFCFLTTHEFFDFFYNILNLIKATFDFTSLIKSPSDEITMTESGNNILKELYSQTVGINKEISIPAYTDYSFKVPDFTSLRKSTTNFFCPLLFSALGLDNFVELLMNILTERSILFVSEDLNLLSSSMYL